MCTCFGREAVGTARASNTEAEVDVEFNNTASSEQIPQAEVVATTLVEAFTNSSNNFNLTINASSVAVVCK